MIRKGIRMGAALTAAALATVLFALSGQTSPGVEPPPAPADACPVVPQPLLGLTGNNYLFVFSDGLNEATWQGPANGFAGNVIVDGLKANELSTSSVPYAGTIVTNDTTLGLNWSPIVTDNAGQASAMFSEIAAVDQARSDLVNAIKAITAMPATSGFAGVASTSLNLLNAQNNIAETLVINVTSGFAVTTPINIAGDKGDLFILRWDEDANFANGFQGQVKFSNGGGIVPLGDLTAANFIHVAGDLAAAGGGSNPPAPYPQGPRYVNGAGTLINGGQNWNGGGFFTGYWLTTGSRRPTTRCSTCIRASPRRSRTRRSSEAGTR